MEFVSVGNAGNVADTDGRGAVGYNYRIGKYEVTNTQWNAFLDAAGAPTGNLIEAYNTKPVYTQTQQPTNNISWYEALQFCNFLTSGDKSKGAYQFGGNHTSPGDFLGIDRNSALSSYGVVYVLPTENEWYKAAYHMNDGITGNYWLYPTQSNYMPSNDKISPDPGNNANFYHNGYTIGYPNLLTAVGTFENSDSAYGTFDQGGNVWEWNETLIDSSRGILGGSFDYHGSLLASSSQVSYNPVDEDYGIGFRVASIVPEPASLLLMAAGGLLIRKRK